MTHFSCADLLDLRSALHRLNPPARLALLGSPVAHSRSPQIHNERLRQLELPCQYVAIDVKAEELSQTFSFLRQSDFIGFNLTMPHKQQALQRGQSQYFRILGSDPKIRGLAPKCGNTGTDPFATDHARLLGAINTVVIQNGKLYGSNTDGPGFVAALREEWNFSLRGRSILILGATGGTGRALAMQSALEGCRQIFLGSRSPVALQEQVKSLSQVRPDLSIQTVALDESSLRDAMLSVDLIVNATPIGFLEQDVPFLIPAKFFQPRHYAYDIVYSTKPTPLMQAANQAGARSADGSSMLRLQAALAFQEWFGKTDEPD